MTRTRLAIASGLLAATALFASGAHACISCEYVPEVAKSPSKATPKASPKAYKAEKRARPAKKQFAKPQPSPSKPDKVDKVDTATKTVPVETQTGGEGSGVSTAALGEGEAEVKPGEETTSGGDVGCKKFSPTAGTTIPVPCE